MWKEQFVKSAMDGDEIDFPMYEEFLQLFKSAFKDVDQVNEAMNDLGQLRQGNKTAEEHTTTFRLLVGKAPVATRLIYGRPLVNGQSSCIRIVILRTSLS